ncbi:hypothetical protein O6H91_18G046500 [Diphasiastrum complanatum]|nr:hypothetical protein O6H91_18G046500 [Diphasiastrum complanatum]
MAEATTHSSHFFFVAKGKSGLAVTATATSTSSITICSNDPFFSQNLRLNRTIRSTFQSIEELGNQRCLRNWQKNGNSIQQLFSANADDGGRCQQNRPLERLPLLVHEGSLRSQYAWDGQCLRTVKLEAAKPGRAQFGRWAADWEEFVSKLMQALRNIFIPEHVRPNYVPYMRWKFLHRVLSSILHVQSTQAMLRAIGVGAQRALPSAAALNWVLKDGLGRFGKLVYAASLGQTFDSDIKRVRFTTSMLFSISLGLEMLTPFFPHHFLLIATLANVGKSISFAAYVSTSSAILKSFALGDNLADIAAKGQVQAVVSDNLGLAIAVAISRIYKFFPR